VAQRPNMRSSNTPDSGFLCEDINATLSLPPATVDFGCAVVEHDSVDMGAHALKVSLVARRCQFKWDAVQVEPLSSPLFDGA